MLGLGFDRGILRQLGWLAVPLALSACNNETAPGRESDSASVGTITATATDTATDGSTSDGTDSNSGTESDTDGPCPAEQDCGDICCEDTQVCQDGVCVLDCGGDDPCGGQCCDDAAGEICYLQMCVVPSGSCSGAACATAVDSECGDNEICDPELGQCVPNLADPTCAFEPEVGVFDPVPRFTWGVRQDRDCSLGCQKEETCNMMTNLCEPTWPHVAIAQDDFPEFHQCVMSPMVADLDGDCIPEIIFHTYNNSNYTQNGILRAIRGDDGSRVFTLSDSNYRVDPGASPAIGDLNGDGSPEIIAPGTGSNLHIIAANGAPIATTENYGFSGRSGSPSIANFDGMGDAEFAYGRAVFDSAGNLLFEGTGAQGNNGSVGPLSCVADLNGDDRPELIAGATAWTFTGTVAGGDFAGAEYWTGAPANGFCGVADFDNNGTPEVVTVNSNDITLFNGQTGAVLGQIAIAGGGAGGPPNIADFDGDGTPRHRHRRR